MTSASQWPIQVSGSVARQKRGFDGLLQREPSQLALRFRVRKGILQRGIEEARLQDGLQQSRNGNLLRSRG